jgi:hypothetical protein
VNVHTQVEKVITNAMEQKKKNLERDCVEIQQEIDKYKHKGKDFDNAVTATLEKFTEFSKRFKNQVRDNLLRISAASDSHAQHADNNNNNNIKPQFVRVSNALVEELLMQPLKSESLAQQGVLVEEADPFGEWLILIEKMKEISKKHPLTTAFDAMFEETFHWHRYCPLRSSMI